MNDEPLISVVIPSRNYARYIAEALESVFAQTYSNIEIVVVDDGSTDDTRAVVAPYLAQGVRYIYEESVGPGAARNSGIACTQGPLVAFLDADDVWLPEKLALQAAHLSKHPDLALVGAPYFQCDEHMQPRYLVQPPNISQGNLLERLLVRNVVTTPTVVLARRPCLEQVGGFTDFPVGQDWDMWIRIAKAFPIGFIQTPVAKKRGHDDKHARRIDVDKKIETNVAIIDRHLGDFEPRWKRPLLRRRSMGVLHFHLARRLVFTDKRLGRVVALRALWLDPFMLFLDKLRVILRATLPERLVFALDRLRNRSRPA